jgi:DNA-binding NarL/FixJ family response regulator
MFPPRPCPPKSLLHVEDDVLWGRAVKQMVNGRREVSHIGTAATAAQGLALCRARQPDLAVLALELPDADGFDLALTLANLPRPPRVLLLTVKTDEVTLFRASYAYIAGMIWKTGQVRVTLHCAIREVLAGRRYFPTDVREAMRTIRTDPTAFFKILSSRELSLLPLLCQGSSDSQIAAQTDLCPVTIRSHRQHIMAKLDLHRTADLIRWAAEKGFVDFLRPKRAHF